MLNARFLTVANLLSGGMLLLSLIMLPQNIREQFIGSWMLWPVAAAITYFYCYIFVKLIIDVVQEVAFREKR